MYIFNKDKRDEILDGRKINYIAEKIGITPQFLSQILNGKRTCSKTVAYCVVKCLDNEKEVEDYFLRNN